MIPVPAIAREPILQELELRSENNADNLRRVEIPSYGDDSKAGSTDWSNPVSRQFSVSRQVSSSLRPLSFASNRLITQLAPLMDTLREEVTNARSRKSVLLHNASSETSLSARSPLNWVRDGFSTMLLASLQVMSVAGYLLMLDASKEGNPKHAFYLSTTTLSSSVLVIAYFLIDGLSRSGKDILLFDSRCFLLSSTIGLCWAGFENLNALAVAWTGAGTTALVQQSRVLFTAMLRTLLLGVEIGELQWQGIALLLVSMVGFNLAQSSNMHDNGSSSASSGWGMLLGVISCVGGSILYALAVTLTEVLYKDDRFKAIPFATKNLYNQGAKLFFSAIYMLATDGTHFLEYGFFHGFFHGWTMVTCAVPVCIALRVLAVQLVLLRLDALVGAFCNIGAVVCVYAFGIALLGRPFNPMAFCFMLLVLQSVLIFGRVGVSLDASAKEARKDEMGRWLSLLCHLEHLMAETEKKLEGIGIPRQNSKNSSGRSSTALFASIQKSLYPSAFSFHLDASLEEKEEDEERGQARSTL